MTTKSLFNKDDWLILCSNCWPEDEATRKKMEGDKMAVGLLMDWVSEDSCCAVCGRSWSEQNEMEEERLKRKLDPKIAMELIDKLRAHKGIKSLKLKWYVVPHPEEDDYLVFVAKKKLKQYPDCEYITGSLSYDGLRNYMDTEIECLFLSLEDMLNTD